MTIAVRPASAFEDVRTLVGPKSPDANVCWCLSYRIPSKLNTELRGAARGDYVAGLCRAEPPPGVLAYDGDEPVGWAAVAPRSDTSFARGRTIPHVDDLPVRSLWCIRVRPGHRGKGISRELISGAVEFARAHGAPAIEAYPLDSGDAKVDLTMAYPGIRKNFERAGFTHASDTTSVLARHPRVLMRLDLRR
ncbi:GNAT family N-acetyltransferase [Streptomyces sp. NPDC102283]|uniref:GNAT family N-acetyltransferase n=1 Tax=Streptomyces sp. NPDC102283 TaxID=3366155 RepID=UPI0038081490